MSKKKPTMMESMRKHSPLSDKTAQHTPGPWTLDPEGEVAVTVEGADGSTVCDVHREAGVARDPRGDANANLITAAPELLALLREVAECADANFNNADMLAHDLSYITPRIAAILRATEGR